jgi:hypothetical protein
MNFTIVHDYPNREIEGKWNEFLSRADFPANYTAPAYFREPFLRPHRQFAILAWDNDEVVAVVTGLHLGSELVCGQMSRPQICFDKDTDVDSASESLIAGLMHEANSSSLITVFTWMPVNLFLSHGYKLADEEGVVMLDLTRGADALFKEFSSTRRNVIRGAIKRALRFCR